MWTVRLEFWPRLTTLTNPSTGLFNSAQINFDDRELYNPTSGTEVLAGGVTFESVALHEIGHAVGLGAL